MKQLTGTSFAVVLAAISSLSVGCSAPASESTRADQSKIVGGTEAAVGAWDGAVALYMGNDQMCGGTLVAPRWVISAGHCVLSRQANGGMDHIVVGRHRLSDTSTGESIKVRKATLHEGFDGLTLANDISLFELETPAPGPFAKLVDPSEATDAVLPGATTTTVGWGSLSEGSQGSDVLMQVDVPIVANDVCKALPKYGRIGDGVICAGFLEQGGHDSCQGDSGGPLFMEIHGQIRHVGLVSWGIGCAEPGNPGIYTRTTTYLDWLKEKSGGEITPTLAR